MDTKSAIANADSLEGAEAAEPEFVEITPRQALQTMSDIRKNFEEAIATPNNDAKILKYYRQAQRWESEVLKPNRLDQRLSASARAFRDSGEVDKADSISDGFSSDGFKRLAARKNVNVFNLLDTKTPEGIRANYPGLSQVDAANVAAFRMGELQPENPNFAKVSEVSRILDTTGQDYVARASQIKHLESLNTEIMNLIPRDPEGNLSMNASDAGLYAAKLSRSTYTSGLDAAQTGQAITSMYELFLPAAQKARDTAKPGTQFTEPASSAAFRQATDSFAMLASTAPQYMPQVQKLLSGDLIRRDLFNDGMNAVGFASQVKSIAPRLGSIERSVEAMFPEGESDPVVRAQVLENMVYLSGTQPGHELFKTDASMQRNANNFLSKVAGANAALMSALEAGEDPMAAAFTESVGVMAEASGKSVSTVVEPIIEASVTSGAVTAQEGAELTEAYKTKQYADTNPRVGMYSSAMQTTDAFKVFPVMADQVSGTKSDPATRKTLAAEFAAKRNLYQKSQTPEASEKYGSVEEAIAATLKLTPESMRTDPKTGKKMPVYSDEDQDKLYEEIKKYEATWGSRFNGEKPDLRRKMEAHGRQFKSTAARVGSLFTGEPGDRAAVRAYYNGSTTVGNTEIKHSDLFANYEEAEQAMTVEGAQLSGKSARSSGGTAFEQAFARAVRRGVYTYNPATGGFVREAGVDVKAFTRKPTVVNSDDFVVTAAVPGTGGRVVESFDMSTPDGVALAMEAITFDAFPTEDPASAWALTKTGAKTGANVASKLGQSERVISSVAPRVVRAPGVSPQNGDRARTNAYDLIFNTANLVEAVSPAIGGQYADAVKTGQQATRRQVAAGLARFEELKAKLTADERRLLAESDKQAWQTIELATKAGQSADGFDIVASQSALDFMISASERLISARNKPTVPGSNIPVE